ncbi:MAG: adenylate/guanylate cyclase domain-containing protein [Gammaproteobacteria bacterium]|nr:MAG: adenylate/guanylate cyclase domain-containing protein [Gammaproteobacteria bacterium]
MSQETDTAILFADVVGSTRLYEHLGDIRAREVVGRCVDIMREETEAAGGRVIKTIGDEVMATFETSDAAMAAARQMQLRISRDSELAFEDGHVAIRVGCHFGPVVREQRDIFGVAVHMANRMTSQAKAGQILTTESTVSRLSPDWQPLVRQIDVATVRGQSGQVGVFEVLWQPEEATSMLPIQGGWDSGRNRRPARLRLRLGSREWLLGSNGRQQVTMGRAEDNDLVVKGSLISRLHVRIEMDRHKFLLIDQSTNGTFIHTAGGEEIFVRRDSTQLTGSGIIGLGRAPGDDSPMSIHYELLEP